MTNLLSAWWQLTDTSWIHVTALLDDPQMRLHLPLLDQLALELELVTLDQEDPTSIAVD